MNNAKNDSTYIDLTTQEFHAEFTGESLPRTAIIFAFFISLPTFYFQFLVSDG